MATSVLGGSGNYVNDLAKHRFDIGLYAIFKGEKQPIAIHDSINDMTVYNFYEENVFPVVQLELLLDWDMYTRIQMNADTVKLKLELKKTQMIDGNIEDENFYDSYVPNAILKPFDISRSPVDKPVTSEDAPEASNNFYLKLDCFLEEHLNINKNLTSTVLKGTSIKNAILFFLNQGKVTKPVLMDDPENTQIYEQLLIPPLNVTNGLKYLNEVYGVYGSGMRVFFDMTTYYILSRDFKNHKAKTSVGEWGTVLIELVDSSDMSVDGSGILRDTKNKTYYMKLANSSQYIVADTSLREISGESVKFLSWTTSNINVSRLQNTSIGSTAQKEIGVLNATKPKQRIMWNKYSNPLAESEYKANMSRTMSRLRIPFSEIDLSVFTMNKRYEINFTNMQYKHLAGTYQMSSLIYKFSKGDTGRLYAVHGIADFERLAKGVLK
jgi:hypothetical protein